MYLSDFYHHRTEIKSGEPVYIVTVAIGHEQRDVAVDKAIFDALEELRLYDRHLINQNKRHIEYSALSDEALYERAADKPKSIEEVAADHYFVEQALRAIKQLPITQARRFVLRNILGCTYPEIGRLEGCKARSAKDSVDLATKKIRQLMKL
jgi:hypothetical protein